jgi:hypothetical protein
VRGYPWWEPATGRYRLRGKDLGELSQWVPSETRDIATTYGCTRQSTVAQTAEARVTLWKLIVLLLILGSAIGTVAVKGAERMGFHSPPYLLPYVWVSDALVICVALWQIKRLKKSN